MGIYAVAYVELNADTNIYEINDRFRSAHYREWAGLGKSKDLILPDKLKSGLYEINLDSARYYGYDYGDLYARGFFIPIALKMEWLRDQPETISVYYGSDYDEIKVWNESDTIEMLKIYFKEGHKSYIDVSKYWDKENN